MKRRQFLKSTAAIAGTTGLGFSKTALSQATGSKPESARVRSCSPRVTADRGTICYDLWDL